MNGLITALTINKAYKLGVFGSTVTVTDDHHKTYRIDFATRQEATDVALELIDRCSTFFKKADLDWLRSEATRSQYIAAGIIAA